MKASHFFFALFAVVLNSCFTGVESTPKISADEVKRQKASKIIPEKLLLDSIAPLPPVKWEVGHRFRVDDIRIGLALSSASSQTESVVGKDLVFKEFRTANSLTGADATEIVLGDGEDNGNLYFYQIPTAVDDLGKLTSVEIPFTVDLELVNRVDSLLRGRRFFVKSPYWYSAIGEHQAINGLRHVPVVVDSVVPGNSNYPAAVIFSIDEPAKSKYLKFPEHYSSAMLYMTLGDSKAATRNFDVLFSFKDPRQVYPQIKDDIWEYIVRSRVKEGMTRDECRLALGAPPSVMRTPSYGVMREMWRYTDGVYLIFDDGILTFYRL